MPAPTAVKALAADEVAATAPPAMDIDATLALTDGGEAPEEEEFMLGTAERDILVAAETIAAPAEQGGEMAIDEEKVPVPPHRMTPLKANWPQIYEPLVKHLKLQVRMNIKSKTVEMRSSQSTTEAGALQKGEDFVKAFTLGFDVQDAIALIRVPELYIQTFEIKDVKSLTGDHLARGVGRIAGKDGKTKFAIENASRTRIVLADSKIHILGSFKNVRMAQESIVDLILGKPPSKVYGNLRAISARMKERF
ncbi:hypothetical protein RB598_006908 [Gaeumannomyces tritici]